MLGPLADRLGRRRIFRFDLVLFIIFSVVCGEGERGRWLVSAFSLQAVGILMGAVVGVVVLALAPHDDSWR